MHFSHWFQPVKYGLRFSRLHYNEYNNCNCNSLTNTRNYLYFATEQWTGEENYNLEAIFLTILICKKKKIMININILPLSR